MDTALSFSYCLVVLMKLKLVEADTILPLSGIGAEYLQRTGFQAFAGRDSTEIAASRKRRAII